MLPVKRRIDRTALPVTNGVLLIVKMFLLLRGVKELFESFEDNLELNPVLKNPVGHISLNFHANDKDKVDDNTMVEIAWKYMEKMGIVDTPYIVVRHLDKDYPHCHIVFSRIDNHAETISDNNDFDRNRSVCLDLTKEYGLHISEGKRQTMSTNCEEPRRYVMRFSMPLTQYGTTNQFILSSSMWLS